jgi:hypothetical protein
VAVGRVYAHLADKKVGTGGQAVEEAEHYHQGYQAHRAGSPAASLQQLPLGRV